MSTAGAISLLDLRKDTMAGKKKQDKPGKFRPTANPELAAAMRALAFSNAAGTHDSRPNRLRTRATTKRAEIQSYRD